MLWRKAFWLAIICVACLLVSASVSWGVFDAMPRLEDEQAQLFQAKVFASGQVTSLAYQPAQSFYIPFHITRIERLFSKYPPGYALVLALGVLVRQPGLIIPLAAVLALLGLYCLAASYSLIPLDRWQPDYGRSRRCSSSFLEHSCCTPYDGVAFSWHFDLSP